DAVLERLDLSYDAAEKDLARIPAKGPVVVVANHPYGLADGLILGALLSRVRPDVKFLANSLLNAAPEIRHALIPVDPFGGSDAIRTNWKSLRQSLEWLKAGGLLVMFPAGEVSSLNLSARKIDDPKWNQTVARLIRASHAATVPVFFHGSNGPWFQFAGLVHPSLRTVLLPRELLNKRGRTVKVEVGGPISPSAVVQRRSIEEATHFLRWRTELLASRAALRESSAPTLRMYNRARNQALEPVAADPVDTDAI